MSDRSIVCYRRCYVSYLGKRAYQRTRYKIEFIALVTVAGSFTDEIVYLSRKEL